VASLAYDQGATGTSARSAMDHAPTTDRTRPSLNSGFVPTGADVVREDDSAKSPGPAKRGLRATHRRRQRALTREEKIAVSKRDRKRHLSR